MSTSVVRSRAVAHVLWVFVGAVAGVVVGAIATACLAGYAVWQTASTSLTTSIPFVISVSSVDGEIRAFSGAGIAVPALAGGMCGAVLAGVIIGVSKWRRR